MNTVITAEQVKKITGGRTPLLPAEYEAAVKALVVCLTLDEAKYWDSKADALAAWAKIHRDDQMGRMSAQLKLYAYRRMGELANQLRPKKVTPFAGSTPGAKSLLIENGFSKTNAGAAMKLSRKTEAEFEKIIAQPRPPSPLTATKLVTDHTRLFAALSMARPYMRKVDPVLAARTYGQLTRKSSAADFREMIEWLDRFEQALPKE